MPREDQGIIDFDTEVTDGAFQFGVPQQQLAGTKVAGALVDQGHFRSPEAMRSVERGIETDQGDSASSRRPYCRVVT
jgi:hypothetical protein